MMQPIDLEKTSRLRLVEAVLPRRRAGAAGQTSVQRVAHEGGRYAGKTETDERGVERRMQIGQRVGQRPVEVEDDHRPLPDQLERAHGAPRGDASAKP